MVAGGNHTVPGEIDAYANVVSNEAVRIGMFLASLNNLDVLVGDVGNAYLHANTNEKVYSVTGPEFGEHEKLSGSLNPCTDFGQAIFDGGIF